MKGLTITVMMILTVALMAGCCGGDSQACKGKDKACGVDGGACKGKCGAGVAPAAVEAGKEALPTPDHPTTKP